MKMQVNQPASQTCLRQDQGQQEIENGTVPEKDNIITIDSSDNEKESVISQCAETNRLSENPDECEI